MERLIVVSMAILVFMVLGCSPQEPPGLEATVQARVQATVSAAMPSPTSASSVSLGTRQNPVPFNRPYVFEKDRNVYAVSVVKVERNQHVQLRHAGNQQPVPPLGHDYIVANMAVAYRSGPEGVPLKIQGRDFQIYAANRLWEAPVSGVTLDPPFGTASLLPGGDQGGWIPAKIVPEAEMDSALVLYSGVYFALK
jgi:hypothetical protein